LDREWKILVVDDDPDARAVVSSSISMLDFVVSEAESGEEALRICQESLPDLVVLDLMMPGMDGNEVCKELRAMEGGELIPIIMLTALDNIKDKVHSLEGGADDYVTKPFNYQELMARIKSLIRVRELNLSLQAKNVELERMQEQLIEQERQLLVGQLAGTAAHQLGQPISAIMLNCHLLEREDKDDEKYQRALDAIKKDIHRMADLVEKLKSADPSKTESYFEGTDILDIED